MFIPGYILILLNALNINNPAHLITPIYKLGYTLLEPNLYKVHYIGFAIYDPPSVFGGGIEGLRVNPRAREWAVDAGLFKI
jgi:hypothetical protein